MAAREEKGEGEALATSYWRAAAWAEGIITWGQLQIKRLGPGAGGGPASQVFGVYACWSY